MVFLAEKWSFRLASCCSVEVMKGAAGLRRRSPRVTDFTRHCAPSSPLTTAVVTASSARVAFSPRTSLSVAVNSGGCLPRAAHAGPVFHRHEGGDLPLALGDEPHRHRLHAAGGQPAADLVPEQRRELVAHQPVQHAPRLLGVHLVLVDLARILEGRLHRALGDLVEEDAVGVLLVDPQLLGQVPADGFALAVGVGGDVQRGDLLGGLLEVVEHLLLGGKHLVLRLEPFFSFTPRLDFGRSRIWPMEALTMKPESRYFWIVLTLVGDSTTTSERDLANGLLSAAGGPDEPLPGQLPDTPLELQGQQARRRAGGGEAAPLDQFFHGHRLGADEGQQRILGLRAGRRWGRYRGHARAPARGQESDHVLPALDEGGAVTDELVGAAARRRSGPSGHRHDLAAEIARMAGGDEGAALLRRLHHHHAE
jgi:hypothetical protein